MSRRSPRIHSAVVLSLCLAAPACGGSYPSTPSTTPPVTTPPQTTGVTITIVGSSGAQAFSPNPASVPTGQTVTFKNTSGSTHRIVADNGAWDAGTIPAGNSSAPIGITAAASFHCTIHGSMTGTLTLQ